MHLWSWLFLFVCVCCAPWCQMSWHEETQLNFPWHVGEGGSWRPMLKGVLGNNKKCANNIVGRGRVHYVQCMWLPVLVERLYNQGSHSNFKQIPFLNDKNVKVGCKHCSALGKIIPSSITKFNYYNISNTLWLNVESRYILLCVIVISYNYPKPCTPERGNKWMW